MLHAAIAIFTEAVFWVSASRARAFAPTLALIIVIWGLLMLIR